jgi:hypothetical protein
MISQAEQEQSILKEERESLHRNKWRWIYAAVIGTLIVIIVALYFFTLYFK